MRLYRETFPRDLFAIARCYSSQSQILQLQFDSRLGVYAFCERSSFFAVKSVTKFASVFRGEFLRTLGDHLSSDPCTYASGYRKSWAVSNVF